MLKMVSNFFETSITALSIYDIFIILLFILAIVLSIVSGIIVISSSIKKINIDLTKTKNIQNINEKIIQNRLDLIISKLVNNQKQNNSNNMPRAIDTNNISNSNIKQAINISEINTQKDDLSKCASNIIKLPPPKTLETTENSDGFDVVNENKEEKITTSPNDRIEEQNINTNILFNSDKISTANYKDENSIIDNKIETININSQHIPESLFVENDKDSEDAIIVNIKEDSDKQINLEINSEEETIDETNNSENLDYESSNKIPLDSSQGEAFAKEKKLEDEDYNNDIIYSQDKDISDRPKSISIANKMLNQLTTFSNEEKFEIVNHITDDGYYIDCLVTEQLVRLDYNELNKQLFIQRLNNQYEYPLDSVTTNYRIKLSDNSIKKCDIVVYDDNNNPYIIGILNTTEQIKNTKLLSKLLKASQAPFGVIINNESINYYQYFNNYIEEISDIPNFSDNIEVNESNILDNHFVSNVHHSNHDNNFNDQNFINSNKYNSFNKNVPKQDSPNYFSRDKYNIYKKNPYSLSEEYKTIIGKYRNLSLNYKNNYINSSKNPNNNFYYNSYGDSDSNISFINHSHDISPNDFSFNLINNNFREQYMNNRYMNVYSGLYSLQPNPRVNYMGNNNNYIPNNRQPRAYSSSNFVHLPRYSSSVQYPPIQPFNRNYNIPAKPFNYSPPLPNVTPPVTQNRMLPQINQQYPSLTNQGNLPINYNNHNPNIHNTPIQENLPVYNSPQHNSPSTFPEVMSNNTPSNVSFLREFKAYKDLKTKPSITSSNNIKNNRLFNSNFRVK